MESLFSPFFTRGTPVDNSQSYPQVIHSLDHCKILTYDIERGTLVSVRSVLQAELSTVLGCPTTILSLKDSI